MTESNYKSKENNNISDSIPQGTYLLPRLQSRAQPHPILYFLTNSAHLSAKKFFPEKILKKKFVYLLALSQSERVHCYYFRFRRVFQHENYGCK